MNQALTTRRVSTVRRIGWLSVASMLALALLAPSAGSALATNVTPTYPHDKNPTCTELNSAWTLSFKIDTGQLQNRAYVWNEGTPVESNWTGQTITLSNLSANGQTFDWSSTLPVSGVLVKAGSDNHALYTYVPPSTGDTGITHGPNQQGISHITFCGGTTSTTSSSTTTTTGTTTTGTTTTGTTTTGTTTTGTTTTGTTTTGTTTTGTTTTGTTTTGTTTTGTTTQTTTTTQDRTTTQATTTQATTQAFTSSVLAETGTPSFSQDVLAETGVPGVTLPPTDALAGTAAPSSDSWRMLLIVMAGLLAGLLLMTPAKATDRRR